MEDSKTRMLPCDTNAESGVISAMMINNHNVATAVEKLREDDFYRGAHKTIFRAMLELFEKNTEIDIITVADKLKSMGNLDNVGGMIYLNDLSNVVISGGNLVYHIKIVLEKSSLRKLIVASNKIIEIAYAGNQPADEIVLRAEKLIFEVAERNLGQGLRHVGEFVDETLEEIDQKVHSKNSLVGTSSGFRDLDRNFGGFAKGQLVILAARPAMGKTSLALNFAYNAGIKTRKKVAIFSMEMGGDELLTRLIAGPSEVDTSCMTRGTNMTPAKLRAIREVAQALAESEIYMDDSGSNSIKSIKSKVMRLKAKLLGLDLIIIDYLQLMSSNSREPRIQQITEISRGLKILAKDLDIGIVALSQLNRGVETRDNKRPLLSDLRESGAIEQDADLVLLIYRDEYYNAETTEDKGVAEIIIAKNRHGANGKIRLHFDSNRTQFLDLDERHGEYVSESYDAAFSDEESPIN